MVTYGEWDDLIQDSFEKSYYVPLGRSLPSLTLPLRSSSVQTPLRTKSVKSIQLLSTAAEFTRMSLDRELVGNGLIISSGQTSQLR